MEVNFLNYIASIAYQTLIFMGENPNPVTNEKQQNLKQAKLLIDTLAMLQEKTQGNLTEEEGQFLDHTFDDLLIKYNEIE